MKAQPWISPGALITAHLAHGLSWAALLGLTVEDWTAPSLRGIAWIHLVALAWITLTALAVLVFVIPQFTDADWQLEPLARNGLRLFALGSFAFAGSLWSESADAVAWSTLAVAIGLAAYLTAAFATLRVGMRGSRIEVAIARAFGGVAAFLAIAAALGVAMAWALRGSLGPWLLGGAPFAHAHLAGLGWLTLLVMGVSARTTGPIFGVRSSSPWRHRVAGTLVLAGALVLAGSLWSALGAVIWTGGILTVAGIALYAFDMAQIVNRATVTHRPPQVLFVAALVWLIVATVLGVATAVGLRWQAAYAFVGLAGWVGQAVIAHLHHIGIRLIATVRRGDEDEIQPGELLTAPLSWLTVAAFQLALVVGTFGLIANGGALVHIAGIAGLVGWASMTLNVTLAFHRAGLPRPSVKL